MTRFHPDVHFAALVSMLHNPAKDITRPEHGQLQLFIANSGDEVIFGFDVLRAL